MNTARLTKLILGAVLIVALIVALQTFKLSASSTASVPVYTGRGDYQRFESQFFPTYTGRGDYQRYEAQFFPPVAGASVSNRSNVGMGDLHRFEGVTADQNAAVPGSDHSYVGMGDLHRYEAMQTTEYADEVQPSSP